MKPEPLRLPTGPQTTGHRPGLGLPCGPQAEKKTREGAQAWSGRRCAGRGKRPRWRLLSHVERGQVEGKPSLFCNCGNRAQAGLRGGPGSPGPPGLSPPGVGAAGALELEANMGTALEQSFFFIVLSRILTLGYKIFKGEKKGARSQGRDELRILVSAYHLLRASGRRESPRDARRSVGHLALCVGPLSSAGGGLERKGVPKAKVRALSGGCFPRGRKDS